MKQVKVKRNSALNSDAVLKNNTKTTEENVVNILNQISECCLILSECCLIYGGNKAILFRSRTICHFVKQLKFPTRKDVNKLFDEIWKLRTAFMNTHPDYDIDNSSLMHMDDYIDCLSNVNFALGLTTELNKLLNVA